MMIELPVNTVNGSIYQLLALRTIRKVEPDRNWTRLTLDNNEEILVTLEYHKTAYKIKEATK